jgi:hypothetical protein
MKIVYVIKDTFENKTFRVKYFQKDCIRVYNELKIDKETGEQTAFKKELLYDKLLFCQRLEWIDNEHELNNYIEEVRQYWENRINT